MNIGQILKTAPELLNVEDFPPVTGTYGEKCKVCNCGEYRRIIDYLLSKGTSLNKVKAYCDTNQILNASRIAIQNHKKNHTFAKSNEAITPAALENKRTQAMDIVRNMDLKGRLNEIEIASFADVVAGKAIPTLKEGLAAAALRKDLEAQDNKNSFMKEFFKAAKNNPIKPGTKSKIKVTPVEGVEITQEVTQ